MNDPIQEQIIRITHGDTRYSPEAYEFVMESLTYTQKHFRREKHVSGRELLIGLVELGVRKFGGLADRVFVCWGLKAPEDLGYIVFNLVDHGVLRRRDEDSMDDFVNAGELREMCQAAYLKLLDRAVRRAR